MPTRSKGSAGAGAPKAEWAARSDQPRRSVFRNYAPAGPSNGRRDGDPAAPSDSANEARSPFSSSAAAREGTRRVADAGLARTLLHQFLARAFDDPGIETWAWLTSTDTHAAVLAAVYSLEPGSPALEISAATLIARLRRDGFESYQMAYVTAFGHAARGDCPLNEIEYGDLGADPLFQPHRLADLAAFYRAFGLEVAAAAAERPDHIGMELEFMSVLAAKEAYARVHGLDEDRCVLCRDAQKKFLREHLGRWAPAFARRLARAATDDALAALAEFMRDFILAECARFNLPPGSEDLLLRPVDEAAENLCASCGLNQLPPGAAAPAM
ncbi:MAG: molecular chaperone TorD family protein [Opitutaceae bacterium]|nr:molecular chaperone TorD family protein [Opitutaceae bacterium]